jgi:hypothetical protein
MRRESLSARVIPSRGDGKGPRDRKLMIQTSLSDTRLFVRSLASARDDKSRITPSENRVVNIENHACYR